VKTRESKKTPPATPALAKDMARLYLRVRGILESARSSASRTVNTTQVAANWLVGREIVEEEQNGKWRAAYGKRVIEGLSERLHADYGTGYSALNLWFFRRFYLEYPQFLCAEIVDALRKESPGPAPVKKFGTVRGKLDADRTDDARALSAIPYAPRKESWTPGKLHSSLSWTHYRTLLRADAQGARAFYEIEAIKNNWTARELERQINSLLFERLAKSKDKGGLLKLATKGQEISAPQDVFKDPVVIEFLGLPESPRLVESDLEQALINNLSHFLLELGKGFAFVSRQERITLDGDHFYIDLVFYHTVLKCYVLIDLKVGKLTHGDLGQMQLYVNYFDRERCTAGDNPTLGLILCTAKNDAVVKYLLGPDQSKKIFASRYKLHLPTEAELVTELKREAQALR